MTWAKRVALGATGEPSSSTELIPAVRQAEIMYDCPVIQAGVAITSATSGAIDLNFLALA